MLAAKAAIERFSLPETLLLFGEPAEKVCGSKPVHAAKGKPRLDLPSLIGDRVDELTFAPHELNFVGGTTDISAISEKLSRNLFAIATPGTAALATLLLMCFDTLTDRGAPFLPHTSSTDPTTPPDAAPHESIQLRTLVFTRRDAVHQRFSQINMTDAGAGRVYETVRLGLRLRDRH